MFVDDRKIVDGCKLIVVSVLSIIFARLVDRLSNKVQLKSITHFNRQVTNNQQLIPINY